MQSPCSPPFLSVIALSLLLTPIAHAEGVPKSRYTSGRAAAMGNAFISFADDAASGLFYNPAALGKLKGISVEPINLQLQANSNLVRQSGTDIYKFGSLSGYRPKLLENPSSDPGASYALLPNLSFYGVAFGLLYQSRLTARAESGKIVYRSVYQLIPSAGFGAKLASGVLRLGYSVQWVNQASGNPSVASDADPLSWNRTLAQGAGFSHQFGLALSLPFTYQPSLNIVARNVGGLKLRGSTISSFTPNPTGEQPEEPLSVDAAASFVTKLGKGMEMRQALEFQDSTGISELPVLTRVALGWELGVRDLFFLRAGFGNGYPSAGIGLRTRRSELNLSWFSEERGNADQKLRDNRYLFHYRIALF